MPRAVSASGWSATRSTNEPAIASRPLVRAVTLAMPDASTTVRPKFRSVQVSAHASRASQDWSGNSVAAVDHALLGGERPACILSRLAKAKPRDGCVPSLFKPRNRWFPSFPGASEAGLEGGRHVAVEQVKVPVHPCQWITI